MPRDVRSLDEFGLDAARRAEIGLIGLIEAISSILLMHFICVLVFIFGLADIMSRHSAPWARWVTDLTLWAVVVVGSGWSGRFIARALSRATRPALPSIAMQQRVPLLLRPFIGAWWLCAAVCVVFLAHALIGTYGWFGSSWKAYLVKYGFMFVVLFMSAVASNAYILLGLWSLTRRATWVIAVWKLRFAIDLSLAIVIPLLDSRIPRYFERLMGP